MPTKYNRQDAAASAALFLVSGAVLVAGTGYSYGTARQMGPASFPTLIALVGIVVSVLLMLTAIRGSGGDIRISWRPLLAVLSAIGVFAVALAFLGVGPAIIGTVMISALADRESRPMQTVVLAALLTFGAWIVFTIALRLPMPMIQMDF